MDHIEFNALNPEAFDGFISENRIRNLILIIFFLALAGGFLWYLKWKEKQRQGNRLIS